MLESPLPLANKPLPKYARHRTHPECPPFFRSKENFKVPVVVFQSFTVKSSDADAIESVSITFKTFTWSVCPPFERSKLNSKSPFVKFHTKKIKRYKNKIMTIL